MGQHLAHDGRHGSVPADFTLATRYQFNGTVRVDFTAVIPASTLITRETLTSIQFTATKPLPPGSVANLESLSFTYQTDHFQRTVATSEGAEDLILPETGVVGWRRSGPFFHSR